MSAEILRVQWHSEENRAQVVLPEDFDLRTNADYGNATFISISKSKLSGYKNGVFLVPGSYGITGTGKTARAGKSAADYSAAFLTKCLHAEKLELWGLDSDFQRADPNIVPNPPTIKRLTYSEASELAYFDHFSFHPRTVEPLEPEHIPVVIYNTHSAKGKTDTLINTETFVEEQVVKSVACSDDITLLKLDGPGWG